MNYNNFNSTIYEDEPITKKQIEESNEFCPQRIKKVRLLENNINVYDQPKEKIFCLQGKLLEDYEDDYVFIGNVMHYFPTYQVLSDNELRGYFTWRTKVRKGCIEKTYLSYAFLYIYELLNQIGVKDPLDGYNKLKQFKEEYEELDYFISKYLIRWINDYVIYYRLDLKLLNYSKEMIYDKNLLILININNSKDKEIIESLNILSSYKICNSPFYKKNQELSDKILINCFKKISEYYENHHRNSLIYDYFGYSNNKPVMLFINCVFYHNMKETYEYKINEIRSYKCDNGYWTVSGYSPYNSPSKKLGNILKTIDSLMRERFNFSRTLKKGIDLKWVDKIINEVISNYITTIKKEREIKIDYSKLFYIRKDSDVTRDKLIVDDEEVLDSSIETEEVIEETNQTNLSKDEYQFLKCLLYNLDYKWVNDKGLMLSVLIDSINEKLFDLFLDNILIYNEKVELIEDYIDELKGMIKK